MKYKIIEILKTFSSQDIKNFERFLNSPYFNESRKIRKLYEILMKHYPEFASVDLYEEKLSYQLNPDIAYNKSTFKSLLFELGALADKFLTIENLGERKFEPEDFLRDEYFKRKLGKYFQQNIEKTEKIFKEYTELSSVYFLHLNRLYTDKFNYLVSSKPKSGRKFISEFTSVLTERAKSISVFFANEIHLNIEISGSLNQTFDINEEKNFELELFKIINYEQLMEFIILNSSKKNYTVLLELNLMQYRLFKDVSNESHYMEYKKYLFKNSKFLCENEISKQYIKLIRYCMMKRTEEKTTADFEKELFNILKHIIKNKYYRTDLNTFLPVELFRLAVKQGLIMNNFKWTLNFIEENHKNLHPDRRENMYYFSMAEYNFQIKNFDEAIKNFNKVDLNHFMLKVDLKCLMMMTYYELGLFENALSVIDAFKHFLTNTNVLIPDIKKRNKAFISVVQKMITLKTSMKPVTGFPFKDYIIPDIPYKNWINEKITELEKGIQRSA